MKQCISIFFVWVLALFLVGCGQQADRHEAFKKWIFDNGKVKVLSTTAMIDDIVKRVGGDHIDSLTLIQGELDPHSYQLVKGDDEKLTFADIIFYSGLGLEHGPSLHSHLNKNLKAVGLGDQIEKSDPSLIIKVNGQKDPHIWMDISLWVKTIPFIVKSLGERDPKHADVFRANGTALENELLKTHEEVGRMMREIPENRRYLVTSHDAFNYFTRAYLSEKNELVTGEWSKRFAAPEGLAPESQLSTTDIHGIIDHMRRFNIHLLFPESNVSRDSIKKILQAGQAYGLDIEIACCPLYGDAMGAPGSDGDSYGKMIVHNAKMIANYMKPNELAADASPE
jgi:manganese/zinc/iron transport system substrate-binding protein